MKRLLTLCLAVGLASIASAQRASVKNYFFQSSSGTFVDLTTVGETVDAETQLITSWSLGAHLNEGTPLQNVFFVWTGEEYIPSFSTITLTDDETSRDCLAVPLRMAGRLSDFSFLDAQMSGFAIAAIGGILFADGSTTDDEGHPTVACEKVKTWFTNEKNAARLYPTNLSGDVLASPTKGANPPVVLVAVSNTKNGRGLWAQFDYMMGDARWLFQIHCYENGRIDYITGNDLGQSALQANAPGFAFSPAAIQDNKNNAVMLGPGFAASGSDAHCWDILNTIDWSEDGLKVTPDCGPEAGRMVSFIPPVSPDAFTMPDDALTATTSSLSGKVVLDPAQMAGLIEPVYAVCLSISKSNDLTMGKYDFPTTEPPTAGFKNNYTTILYVGKPSDLSQPFEMPFEAEGLSANTEYALHVNLCYYTPGAYNPYSYYTNPDPDLISLKVFSPLKTATPPPPPAELPYNWDFRVASNPGSLPDGWQRDNAVTSTDAAAFNFVYLYNDDMDYSKPYALTSQNTTLTNGIASAGLITRAVQSAEDNITATFNIRLYDFVDGYLYVPTAPKPGDSVRIDYRLDGGEWQRAATFKTLPEADAATDIITLYATVSGTADREAEFRYTRYTSTENTANSIESVYISKEITCFPPVSLTVDTANVTDTQIALQWKDHFNTAATYAVAYQTTDAANDAPWAQTTTNGQTMSLTGLNPNTAYRMKVQAVCADEDASAFNHTPAVFATYNGLPYNESMGNVSTSPTDYTTPGERGVKTYVGQLGGTWQENNNYETWNTAYSASGQTSDIARAMGTNEEATNAILTTSKIYTHEATRLTFNLNSFSLTKNEDNLIELVANGATPTEADCRLMVAVSNRGTFTQEDVILTLTGAELNLVNKTFQFDIAKTGLMQIAFFFENPVEHWFTTESKFNLEVYDVALTTIPKNYTLTLNTQPTDGGTVSGAGSYAEGASVTIAATANEGYDFVAWMDGGVELSKSAAYTFRMPSANTTYTAVFRSGTADNEEHELTLTASPANGGRISGDGFYFTDEDVTIQAEANTGYKFVAWINGTDTLSKEATYSFKMPARDTAFTAKFVENAAIETLTQADFCLNATHGQLQIHNLNGLTVKSVTVYTLTGNRLARFTSNSHEDLNLPVSAEHALLFVRIDTEKGAAVYKVFLP